MSIFKGESMTTAWEVVYNDKSTLRQFNDDGSENSFSTIRLEEVFEFRIFHEGKLVSLFIQTGTFGINGLLYDTDLSRIDGLDYRLIHFVRRKKVLGQGQETDTYFIGFQVTKDEVNHKRMISVCNNQIQLINK